MRAFAAKGGWRGRLVRLGYAVLVGGLWLLVTLCLTRLWHRPTRVEINVLASQIAFRSGSRRAVPLLREMPASSISVQRFASLSFAPATASLAVAIPREVDAGTATDSTYHWQRLKVVSPRRHVVLTGQAKGLTPSVTIEPVMGSVSRFLTASAISAAVRRQRFWHTRDVADWGELGGVFLLLGSKESGPERSRRWEWNRRL